MLSQINLKISEKLRDRKYRQRFFRGRTQDEVAYQLRRFRNERELSQTELARKCGMRQSAVSRLEQASYSRWGIQTIWRIAEALDLRVRVVIDDAMDAIKEYEQIEAEEATAMTPNADSRTDTVVALLGEVFSEPNTEAGATIPFDGAFLTHVQGTTEAVNRHRSQL